MNLKEQQKVLDENLFMILQDISKHSEDFYCQDFWQKQIEEYGSEEKAFKENLNFMERAKINATAKMKIDNCTIKLNDLSIGSIYELKQRVKKLTSNERQKPMNPQLHYVLETFETMKDYEDTLKENLENIEQAKLHNNKKLVEIFELRQKQLNAYPVHDIKHKETFTQAKTSPYIQKQLLSKEYQEYEAIRDYVILKRYGQEMNPSINFSALMIFDELYLNEDTLESVVDELESKIAEQEKEIDTYRNLDGSMSKSKTKTNHYGYLSRSYHYDCERLGHINKNKEDVEALINYFYFCRVAA
jgi:hypothetical protein